MPKSDEEYNDGQGRRQRRKAGQDEDLIAAEKYNPALRGDVKSQEQVESSGGLGALARKIGMKKETPTPEPRPTPEEKKKKKILEGMP